MKRTAFILMVLGCSTFVSAAELHSAASQPDWTIDIGAGSLLSPKFLGAKHSTFRPIPFIAIDYKDFMFASVKDGIGANILNTQGFTAGPTVNLDFGRRESGSTRFLAGLGNIDPTLQVGAFVQYELAPFSRRNSKFSKASPRLAENPTNRSPRSGESKNQINP